MSRRNKTQTTAHTSSTSLAKLPAPKIRGEEQGTSGNKYSSYFDNELGLGNRRNPSVHQIMRMLDEDGTAAGLYNVITFPVLATDWHIEPDPADVVITKNADGTETEAHPQAEFVEKALRDPLHKGGMSTPFSLVLADILLGVAQGHRFFEIVYKLNNEGMIVFQKVAARDYGDYTIKTDDSGGFAGVEQMVYKDGITTKVFIDIPYSFLFTYRKERRKLLGLSAFRAAFYHYDKKHRLYYLANQQAQQAAVNPKVLTAPDSDTTKEQREANLAAVDAMAVRPAVALPFGWELDIPTIGKGVDLGPYLDHHNVEMARSVLAQMMMLGTQTGTNGGGGSYALSSDHTDLFMLGEQTLITTLEEHITSFLISKLIDYNFDNPLYPTFKFNDMTDSVSSLLTTAFNALVTKGTVPDWVTEGISEKVAEQMEINKPVADGELSGEQSAVVAATGDALQAQALNGAQVASLLDIVTQVVTGQIPFDTAKATIIASFPFLTSEQVDAIINPAKDFVAKETVEPAIPPVENSRKKKQSRFAKTEWWRELTPAEGKVQFSTIQKKADDTETSLLDDIKPIFVKLAADTAKRIKPLLEDKGAKALDGFQLSYSDELSKLMATYMIDVYSAAKTGAADELKVKAPANKQSSKDLMKQHTNAIVEKQYADILFNLKMIVTDAVRKNLLDKTELSVASVVALISAAVMDFYDDKEELTVASLITTAINIGRDDLFKDNDSDIYAYQYSAILDEHVCPICEDLDGSVVNQATYDSTIWMPPIHFNCRCLWVAIMNDEEDKPDFEDLPDSPGGADAPSLSKDLDDSAIYLSKQTEALWQLKRK